MNYKLFFGTQQHCIFPDAVRGATTQECRSNNKTIDTLCKNLNIQALATGHQVHETNGVVISSRQQAEALPLFSHDADFLVTNIPNIGLAVITADCLPITFYDPVNHVIGIAHAGWRGTVGNIAVKTVHALQQQFGSKPEDIRIAIGPCARTCCYEVDQIFIDNLNVNAHKFILRTTNSSYVFDMVAHTVEHLLQCGVKKEHIDTTASICTICSPDYCSYRRMNTVERNINIIALEEPGNMNIIALSGV